METVPPENPTFPIRLFGRSLDMWQSLFYLLLLGYAAVVLFTFPQYGVNPDEPSHIAYGEAVVRWYTSFFQERAVAQWTNTWLYGGAYDTAVFLITRISPFPLHETRHLCNAAMGLLGLVGAYRLGKLLGTQRTGFLAALFLVLTPRYYGHAFINHKDLPFAVLCLWSIYLIARGLASLPRLPKSLVWKTGLITGLAMGIRVGGGILLGYLGIFFALRSYHLLKTQPSEKQATASFSRSVLLQTAAISIIAYGTMLLFWPWAQLDPLVRPLKALAIFSSFSVETVSFFQGAYVASGDIPWYYAPWWLLLTLPEFLLFGLGAAAFLPLLPSQRSHSPKNSPALQKSLLVFSALFPLALAILTSTPLCNGIRHLLFVVPPLAVLAAVGADQIISFPGTTRWVARTVLVFCLSLTLWDMVHLHPNEYVYFNRLFAGGTGQASARYETDYYQHAYTQGLRWIDENIPAPDHRKLIIASGSSRDWFPIDEAQYEYTEASWEADVYLVSTHLDIHRNIPGEVLHKVQADGADLLYIIRPDTTYSNQVPFVETPTPYRYLHLGRVYENTGKQKQALETYRKALDYGPESLEARIRIAEIFFNDEQFADALELFLEIAQRKPGDALSHANIAKCEQSLENFEKAVQQYEHALRLRPDFLFALHNLGICLTQIGKTEQAEARLRQAIQTEPNYAYAHVTLAAIKREQGDLKGALALCLQAVEIDPTIFKAFRLLGPILNELGYKEKAVEAYQRAISLNPNDEHVRYYLGNLLYSLERADEAEQQYREALRLEPGLSTVHRNLGVLLLAQGKFTEAISPLQTALSQDAAQPDIWYSLARAHRGNNNLDAAHKTIAKAILLNPSNAEYWTEYFNLGTDYHRAGRMDQAQIIYQEVREINPDLVDVHVNLGILYFSQSQFQEAVVAFKEALRLRPKDLPVFLGLAQSYQKQGRISDAIREYRQALTLDPNNTIAQDALQTLSPKK